MYAKDSTITAHQKFPDTESLQRKFRSHSEYSLIHIPNFLDKNTANNLAEELDHIPLEECKRFTRANSCMYEHNRIWETPRAQNLIHYLHSSPFIRWLQAVTDTRDLIPDPHLVGAGYMKSFRGDSLKIHTDFNWNDQIRLHRQLSIVIYLNDEWQTDWGGQLQFYAQDRQRLLTEIPLLMGNCVIWNYNLRAYHGYPNPMQCPKGISRKGIRVFYYVSNAQHRPTDPPHRSLYWYHDATQTPYDQPWKK